MSAACQARFASRSERMRTIEFDIVASVDEHFSRYLSYCVSFFDRRRTWLFIAQQREFQPVGPMGLSRLALKTPSHIVVADIRRALRVPLASGTALEVRLTRVDDGATLDAEVIDVGLGGMAVHLPECDAGDLRVGSIIMADLRLGRDAITLRAEVRHCEGGHLGLMFPEVVTGEVFEPPGPYRRIVRSLEARWFTTLGQG